MKNILRTHTKKERNERKPEFIKNLHHICQFPGQAKCLRTKAISTPTFLHLTSHHSKYFFANYYHTHTHTLFGMKSLFACAKSLSHITVVRINKY